MDSWQLDFEWLRVRHFLQTKFNKPELPDLNAVLFLIGLQELGQLKSKISKEEKQDLMHIAVCRLLSTDGFFEFAGIDQDGWPHWKQIKNFPYNGVKEQSSFLKEKIVDYFRPFFAEEE